MQQREQGFMFLPQMKGNLLSFQRKRVRCIGCCEITSSSTVYCAGMKDGQEKKNCAKVAQEPELATQEGYLVVYQKTAALMNSLCILGSLLLPGQSST